MLAQVGGAPHGSMVTSFQPSTLDPLTFSFFFSTWPQENSDSQVSSMRDPLPLTSEPPKQFSLCFSSILKSCFEFSCFC